ncbi:hypothetical protein DPMN_188868 [Dreissena polymorpha]|uniref:Uncharacterized protein n=1 Tax=Dreissena polymorpha TaxID=45954 RepID=A0A9D4DUJ6_DREPO|nr:hypothetical protein DPMN_188868 [Dreissena polymorpha]
MIADIGWKPFQERRKTAKVIMMYRITNNLIDIPPPCYNYHKRHSIRHIVSFCRLLKTLLPVSNKFLEPTSLKLLRALKLYLWFFL